jgi:hypothetical protein
MTHSDNHALPSRCDQPERKFSHTRGQSWTIRITVLNMNTVNACSSCSWSVDRVQQATVATEQTLFAITTKSNEDDKEISTGSNPGVPRSGTSGEFSRRNSCAQSVFIVF